jgi:DNA-binding HxlR family transcriptional regulator
MPRQPPPPVCPVDALLRLLMGSWTTYILWHLRRDGPIRFGALQRAIPGLSAKVLTQRLRLLEERGIVYRDHVPSIPPAVSYGLTAQGKELGSVFDAPEDVSSRWLARAQRAGGKTRARSLARPAARRAARAHPRAAYSRMRRS